MMGLTCCNDVDTGCVQLKKKKEKTQNLNRVGIADLLILTLHWM